MTARARTADPQSSHRAASRINTAQANAASETTPTEAVEACVTSLREFSEREIRLSMKLRFPGDNEISGSICSWERIRGVLSDMKKAGKIEPLTDEPGQTHSRFRVVKEPVVVPVEPVKTVQTSMF